MKKNSKMFLKCVIQITQSLMSRDGNHGLKFQAEKLHHFFPFTIPQILEKGLRKKLFLANLNLAILQK